jgi:hypothetical protein
MFGNGAQELYFTCVPVACSDHAIAMGGQGDLMSGSKLGNAAPVATNPNGEGPDFVVHNRRTRMESQTGDEGAILLKCVVFVAMLNACMKDILETLVLASRQTLDQCLERHIDRVRKVAEGREGRRVPESRCRVVS